MLDSVPTGTVSLSLASHHETRVLAWLAPDLMRSTLAQDLPAGFPQRTPYLPILLRHGSNAMDRSRHAPSRAARGGLPDFGAVFVPSDVPSNSALRSTSGITGRLERSRKPLWALRSTEGSNPSPPLKWAFAGTSRAGSSESTTPVDPKPGAAQLRADDVAVARRMRFPSSARPGRQYPLGSRSGV